MESGEELVSVSAGDTVRWVIGDTTSGANAAQRVHILVKPIRTGLRTNLLITTDRRTYHLELSSTTATWMAAVSWQYPLEQLSKLKDAQRKIDKAVPVADGLNLESLNFEYEVSGPHVSWRPIRAFDDGEKVYIQFPSSIAQSEMPPLFIVGPKAQSELVNYRVRSPYYIVDRLFQAAELRLGGRQELGSCFSRHRVLKVWSTPDSDVLVVGAGLAGLSAALEASQLGATVTVIDAGSVYGGHAVMSGGDVAIIDTPLQQSNGISDSPDLAFKDFIAWGNDANPEWVRYYVANSRAEVYDWLTSLGVPFEGLRSYPGNSVPRAHITQGRGLGLVCPVYRRCLAQTNITFVWNTRADDLLVEDARVVGAKGHNLRTGQIEAFKAESVILATGGFQNNLKMVLEHWPRDLPKPGRLLAGSGVNSVGSGIALAAQAGGTTFNMDHQWNYERGLPDPRFPGANRGLKAVVEGLKVNSTGRRISFTGQSGSYDSLRAVLAQPGGTYWAIFDEKLKNTFWISGSNWGSFQAIQEVILDDPDIVKRAETIKELASKTKLPIRALRKSIADYNKGSNKISTPPFYAAEFYPLTRKSMGGISIDQSARVLGTAHRVIRGLYAAGEAAGEAGINGKAALEGTFLGPAVVTGRVAARTAVADLKHGPTGTKGGVIARAEYPVAGMPVETDACTNCHHLRNLVEQRREGYWHSQQVHRTVLQRKYDCFQCHAGIGPSADRHSHVIDSRAQIDTCQSCHVPE